MLASLRDHEPTDGVADGVDDGARTITKAAKQHGEQASPARSAAAEPDESTPDSKAKKTPPDDDDEGGKTAEHKGLLQRPILLISGAVLLLLAVIGGLIFWLNARNFETTDDAFVDTHIVRLAPQVSGRVVKVLVNDNQQVKPNELLVVIDSAELQTHVAQTDAQKAQAQVDNARAEIKVNQSAYQQALAEVAAAVAPAERAARDLDRYRVLQRVNPAAVAQQQFDQAKATAEQTTAQLQSAVKAAKGRADMIAASRAAEASGEDQVKAAQAQLNAAAINEGYSQLVSPTGGYVAQKTVAAGNYVEAGTQLLAIVPFKLWITANYKETQLALMRAGQAATVHVDACPKA
jgi:membrane fusion protein (multidrug efflux system)